MQKQTLSEIRLADISMLIQKTGHCKESAVNFKSVDALYGRYGFQVRQAEDEFRVYGIRQGVFYGVEIVCKGTIANVECVKREYEQLGYATRIRKNYTLEQLEEELFEGFFDKKAVKRHLEMKYREYADKQTQNIGREYEYIPCPYRIFSDEPDDSILSSINEVLSREKPQLVIVEAAAGYGKTSTAFELLRCFIESENSRNPIFTELSRNRQAKIFRYVLLDEIDRVYPVLRSEIVEYEIKSGRIPLIVDGFDELLQKGSRDEESFNAVESMLETIGELLTGQAKIVLTSRRTAIFAGNEFDVWMESKSENFEITRYKIDRPNINTWVGSERVKKMEECGAPLKHLSNPVILSYLRGLEDNKFYECCGNVDGLMEDFFKSLLEREQERQELTLSVEEQKSVFIGLAYDMVAFDMTSDEKSFIAELLEHKNQRLLSQCLQRYKPSSRPSIDGLVETLCNHALLDRVGSREDNIGFLNQFVFGYMIALAVIDAEEEWLVDSFATDQFVSLASTAFAVRSDDYRNELYSRISVIDALLSDSLKMKVDIDLKMLCLHDFQGATFKSMHFADCAFLCGVKIVNTGFFGCFFENVTFDRDVFEQVNFIDCSFKDCEVQDENESYPCWFIGCEDYGSDFIDRFNSKREDEPVDDETNLELDVLRQFWPIGRPNALMKISYKTLTRGFDEHSKRYLPRAIDSLVKRGLIYIRQSMAYLNREKMYEIRKFLQR